MGHDRIGPCGHNLITLCSYYNNPVNVGITYIPSADLYYRLVEFYSLSRPYGKLISEYQKLHCVF